MVTTAQPIAGVSTQEDSEIMTVYPSIGSSAIGRGLGMLYDSVPLGRFPVKLSHLLFTLPTAPLAVAGYFDLKVRGNCYRLTTRSLQVWKAVGNRMVRQISLSDITDIEIEQRNGQAFFKCADLHLLGRDGKTLLTLEGIPHASVFRQTILKARDAAEQVRSSLATIDARQPA